MPRRTDTESTRLRELLAKAREAQNAYTWFPMLLFAVALWLLYGIFAPFIDTIIFAIVLAAIASPLHGWAMQRLRLGPTTAALAVTLLVAICVLIPATLFMGGLVGQAKEALAQFNLWLREHDPKALVQEGAASELVRRAQELLPFVDLSQFDITTRMLSATQALGQRILTMSTQLLGNAVVFLIHFTITIFFLFYLLLHGKDWLDKLVALVPMRTEQVEAVVERLGKVCKAVLVGGLLVALLQGVVGGVGMALMGLPGLFWGTMMAFASLIPVLGTGLIWVPAALFLLLVGRWEAAIFLAAWCAFIVVQIDTFLRPYFMKGSTQVPVFFIFLSVLGGVNAFGPAGILYGPLILSFATAMLRIYGQEYAHVLSSTERTRSRENGTALLPENGNGANGEQDGPPPPPPASGA